VNDDKDYFRRWFAGKIVLFGTVQDAEDRRLTSKRFATRLERARTPRCALEQKPLPQNFRRSTIAGVYIHATAVNNLIAHNAVTELGRLPIALIAILAAIVGATAARLLHPAYAALAYLAAVVLYVTGATLAFVHAFALPLSEPLLAGAAALALTGGYRFIVTDKDRRLLQKSFALYLAPHVIERMLTSSKLPELGGETRHVTIFFSDLESFSEIAEDVAGSADGADERVSVRHDRRHREPWRLCRQIYRRFDRRDLRRAGSGSRPCCERRTRRARLLPASCRIEQGLIRLPGPQADATRRNQFG
jgi:adenylate cyclase/guanylate cyclase